MFVFCHTCFIKTKQKPKKKKLFAGNRDKIKQRGVEISTMPSCNGNCFSYLSKRFRIDRTRDLNVLHYSHFYHWIYSIFSLKHFLSYRIIILRKCVWDTIFIFFPSKRSTFKETSTTPSCGEPIPAQKIRGNSIPRAVFFHIMVKMDVYDFYSFSWGKHTKLVYHMSWLYHNHRSPFKGSIKLIEHFEEKKTPLDHGGLEMKLSYFHRNCRKNMA